MKANRIKNCCLWVAAAALITCAQSGCKSTQSTTTELPPPTPAGETPRAGTWFKFKRAEVSQLGVIVQLKQSGASSEFELEPTVDNAFTEVLLNKNYTLISQSAMNTVIEQIKKGGGVLTDKNTAAEVGKLVNASHIVVIKMPQFRKKQFGYDLDLVAQIIKVETAEVVGTAEGSSRATKYIPGFFGQIFEGDPVKDLSKLARQVASAFP